MCSLKSPCHIYPCLGEFLARRIPENLLKTCHAADNSSRDKRQQASEGIAAIGCSKAFLGQRAERKTTCKRSMVSLVSGVRHWKNYGREASVAQNHINLIERKWNVLAASLVASCLDILVWQPFGNLATWLCQEDGHGASKLCAGMLRQKKQLPPSQQPVLKAVVVTIIWRVVSVIVTRVIARHHSSHRRHSSHRQFGRICPEGHQGLLL